MRLINFLAGFAAGVIVGVVAILLLTPYSGSDLRQGARSRLDTMLEEARTAAAERRAELEEQLAVLRSGEA